VELGADDVAARDHGGDLGAVPGGREQIRAVGDLEAVGMHEIDMIARRHPVEEGVRLFDLQIVPAHVRDLEGRIIGPDAPHRAADPAKARGLDPFLAHVGKHLHADAISPGRASSAARHAAKAPSPGSTIRPAPATASGSPVTRISPAPVSAAMR
jgi:hypothetical protein